MANSKSNLSVEGVASQISNYRDKKAAMNSSTMKLKYNSGTQKLHTTLGMWVDDVKLKLSFTEKALQDVGSAKDDLEIAVEKPGHFMIEHHLHKKSTRFQFHGSAEVLDKDVKLTFIHHILPIPVTTLEAVTHIDKETRLVVKHNFAKSAPVVKAEYSFQGTTISPQYDFGAGKNHAWGLAVKHGKKEMVRAAYHHHRKEAEIEVHKKIDGAGPLKLTATVDVNNLKKVPKFVIEKEWKL